MTETMTQIKALNERASQIESIFYSDDCKNAGPEDYWAARLDETHRQLEEAWLVYKAIEKVNPDAWWNK